MSNGIKVTLCSVVGGLVGVAGGATLGVLSVDAISESSEITHHVLSLVGGVFGAAAGGNLGLYIGTYTGQLVYNRLKNNK